MGGADRWWRESLNSAIYNDRANETSMNLTAEGWKALCGDLTPGRMFALKRKRETAGKLKEEENDPKDLRLSAVYPHFALFEVLTRGGGYRTAYGWHELARLRMTGQLKQKSRSE